MSRGVKYCFHARVSIHRADVLESMGWDAGYPCFDFEKHESRSMIDENMPKIERYTILACFTLLVETYLKSAPVNGKT